jgi:hypothetical protein
MNALNTNTRNGVTIPPPNVDDEVEANQINAKPKPADFNGGMMTSTDDRRASSSSPPRRLSANHDDNTSPTSSSGSSSSTPTPTAANQSSGLLQAGGTTTPHHTSLSPHHVRKSPDPGLRRNPSAGSGTSPLRYSGLISVPEEGNTSMDFSTSSLQPPTSASTITARNYGSTSFLRPRDEGRRPYGQSPPTYLGGLSLDGEDPDDSEDEDDLEDWLIDEELASQGLYRGLFVNSLSRAGIDLRV